MARDMAAEISGLRIERRLWQQKPDLLTMLALLCLASTVLIAILGPWIAPTDFNDQNLLARLKPPLFADGTTTHLLGTDELGRDVLSRLLYALRISLGVGLLGTAIGAVFGSLIGVLAAHRGGLVEEALLLIIDFQAAIPFMLFALAALALFGNSLLLFTIVLGLYGWETYARLVRSMVLSAQGQIYVEALRGLGFHPLRIYCLHVLPNIVGPLLVQTTMSLPGIILLESSLSFLGLGIQPPLASLGLLIGQSRLYMETAWWLTLVPGLAIFLIAWSTAIAGDWLRDRVGGKASF
ncbi:ABC transporter permease [Bradyrhizobium tunisiense]|uniref:ABC transporter permease n=1 Tax=Bradyrhizobium tunisiense TaxID=3278709 RepID=UPI0035DE0851